MEGYWPIFFLLVVLKVPAVGMIWLLYWAARNEPENGILDEGEDGGGRRRPRPLVPRGPRRGPHGGGASTPNLRTRSAEPAAGHLHRSGGGQAEPARARERDPARARDLDRSL